MQYRRRSRCEARTHCAWAFTCSQGTWGLSSVLGTLEVHPIDMVQVYTVFANYGQYIPHAIDKIADSTGNDLYQYHDPQPVQVMDPRIAFLITSILSDNPSRAGRIRRLQPSIWTRSSSDCVRAPRTTRPTRGPPPPRPAPVRT